MFDNCPGEWGFSLIPVFPPFSFRDMRDHAMCDVIEGEHTHSLLGAAGKFFHVCHFLQVYNSGWCSALFFFLGPTVSVLVQVLSCQAKEVIKIDEFHTYRGSGRFCLPEGFISSQLYITPEQWLSQLAAQGRRSSPQGPCPAAAVLGHKQRQLVLWLCLSQRITDISLALTLIKCTYSEQNAGRLLCILTKVLSLRRLPFLLHTQLLLQFYLFFTLQKVNSHKCLNSKKPSIFCWNELVFKYCKSVIS